ncbi:MAG: GNAT family N-acetyltransferase [Alphaproteobacteria bacterium]|nr:MAG: GNAT family N-acetyltransferase [Alphaproteobacteria bacterium]
MRFKDGSIVIEPLAAHHDRASFTCSNETLDHYIREQAGQDTRRGIARVFVAVAVDDPHRILGFFTLSATSVTALHLPVEVAKRLPRHPVPAALLGRLAVDRSVAGCGLGGILLADAVKRTLVAAQTLAAAVIVVDPIGDAAQSFYANHGFRSLEGPERRMFLMLSARGFKR